jgi:hypothetical protein
VDSLIISVASRLGHDGEDDVSVMCEALKTLEISQPPVSFFV